MFSVLNLYEYVGNMHMHTPYSDGEGSHADIVTAMLHAGIDFGIVTDHNVLVKGIEGYHGSDDSGYVLLMIGEEVHDQSRLPQVNHLLVYGAETELAQCACDPQELIDAVNAAGGLCFLAHPNDVSIDWVREVAIPWVDLNVRRFTGLEIWNYMSSIKELMQTPISTVRAVFRPEEVMVGPNPNTLALWDSLLASGLRVVGIGNADAHATRYHIGPFSHVVFPYDFLFNCVNTHILLAQPLTGSFERDKAAVYRALRAGNLFISYDLLGNSRGFRFSAHGQSTATMMGGTIRLGTGVTLQTIAPERSHIRILLNGTVVAEEPNRENLTYTAHAGGAYRVEVWKHFKGKQRAWILSNPIYVEDGRYSVTNPL